MLDLRSDNSAIIRCIKNSFDPTYRLFCFPHGGGSVQSFGEWAKHLPDDVELLCLDLPGRGKKIDEPAIRNMDVLVSIVSEALRGYVDRPFVFFGHSMGSLVAYEVARSLEKAGRPSPFHVIVSAHKAADVPADEPPMYQYHDDQLANLVRSLGIVPEDALENQELLTDFILPPLRADFELSETYDRTLPTPIRAALTAMGGTRDALLDADDLDNWSRLTTSRFSRLMFEGDHFYVRSMAEDVVSALLRETEEVKAQLPPSIQIGELLPYPDKPLHELFRAQAALTPESPAVVSDTTILTYRELDHLSEQLSGFLGQRAAGQSARVGILMDTSPEYVVALFGILKSGGAYVVLDPAQPRAALGRILEKARIETVITNDRFASALPENWTGSVVSLDDGWATRIGDIGPHDTVPAELNSPAQIVFSSGTTGEPKGIVCPHRSAVASYQWRFRELPYDANEREAVNIFLVWEVMRPILAGIPAYMIPDDIIYDPFRLVRYLEQNQISRILLTPSLFDVLLGSGALRRDSLPNLRLIYLNGEVVNTALVARAQSILPHVRLINDYSIAETHDVAHLDLGKIDLTTSPSAVPVGTPQDNVNIYVLNKEMTPVATGFVGEVFIGGHSVGLGYLDSPDMTRERFLPDPFSGRTMFRTGDAGRMLPDGRLEIIGRRAFMVKIRGYSVVPGAVEAALLRHPDVRSAAVVPELDAKTGQPNRLTAYVVLHNNRELSSAELRAHLGSELPHYAIPSDFIFLAELPIAPNGKLDRSRLRSAVAEIEEPRLTIGPTVDAVEPALRAAWRDLLNTSDPKPSDNFFDFGGHSLLAAQLCSQLRESIGLELRVVEVFLNPTFEALLSVCRTLCNEPGQLDHEPVDRGHQASAVPAAPKEGRNGAVDIAVIGMAARFPGADTIDALWKNLCQGTCSVTPISREKLKARGVPEAVLRREDYIQVGAHITEIESFDPSFWGLSQKEAVLMDPQHRLFLECCWKALEASGYRPNHHEGRTGVFAGSFLPLYLLHHLKGGGLTNPLDAPLASLTEFGNDKDYLVSRVSYMLNLTGPSVAVQTSCSTGLVAIATAAQSLASGHCDMALAGAASIVIPQAGYQFVDGFINSPDGKCRAFDADANGTVLGDGVGVVVLKRLEDAVAAGDSIQAVIKGYAVNNDGRSKASFSAPSAHGQAEVVRQALESASLNPHDVEYIETHGTGTKIGDPIEVRALASVFAHDEAVKKTCALGSIKPNIGHSNICAGVAGFIKAVLCLRHQAIPPTININRLNADLELEKTPFFVNERLRPWPRREGRLRAAGVTSLGIGGTNCHVVLQEWVDHNAETWPGSVSRGPHALCLSAKTPSALGRACADLAKFLRRNRDIDLGDVAHTLRTGRCEFDYRTVVVASSLETAIKRLEEEADRAQAAKVHSSPSLAFMLPGGGVQHQGMFEDLYNHAPAFRETFRKCATIAESVLSRSIEPLIFGPERDRGAASFEEINVAMFSVQYSTACLLKVCGVHPEYLVGQSMSEYVVAALAGIMTEEDAIKLMVARGRAMADLGIDGGMLAAKCGPEEAERILAEEEWRPHAETGEIAVGVVNSRSSIVFTGKSPLLERLQHCLAKAEIPNQLINTAGIPSHSPLMKPAAHLIDAHVRGIKSGLPKIQIALNVSGERHPANSPMPETYWSTQATGPIRFDQALQAIVSADPVALVDLGPSRNLYRFAGEAAAAVEDKDAFPAIIAAARDRNDTELTDCHVLLECLGSLWCLGVAVDWLQAGSQLEAPGRYRRIPLPTYSFDRHRCWPDDKSFGLVHGTEFDETERRWGEVFTYTQSWTESPLKRMETATPDRATQHWLILADDTPTHASIAEEVSKLLEKAGHEVVHACRRQKPAKVPMKQKGSRIFIDPTRAGLKALIESQLASECSADRILCLWPFNACPDPSEDRSTAQAKDLGAYEAVLDLTRHLAATSFPRKIDLWIVADRCVQVGDEEVSPEKACLFGPAIVLPQENPMLRCRLIDPGMDNCKDISERLFAEVAQAVPGPDALVALRRSRRWVPHYPEVPLAGQASGELRADGVYLITGGLGRIGLSLTEHLVTLGATVVATTRRSIPNSEEWENSASDEWMRRLAALKDAPGRILVCQSDVANFEDLWKIFEMMIRDYGRIDGIFHAAGLADLQFLSEMDDTVSAREFASKVFGTRHIHASVEKMRSTFGAVPEFVFTFSSLASILGGPAMAAYAAANRFIDVFSRDLSGKFGVRWVNSNWDDWDYSYEGQVTAAYSTSRAKDLALSPEEGISIIKRILATVDSGQVVVATTPLPTRLQTWVDQNRGLGAGQEGEGETPRLPTAGTDRKPSLSEDEARQMFLAEVKALLNASTISLSDNFFDIGGDSLLATALQVRLKSSSQWRPPRLDEIFKARTFGQLFDQISQK